MDRIGYTYYSEKFNYYIIGDASYLRKEMERVVVYAPDSEPDEDPYNYKF